VQFLKGSVSGDVHVPLCMRQSPSHSITPLFFLCTFEVQEQWRFGTRAKTNVSLDPEAFDTKTRDVSRLCGFRGVSPELP
jgi:hypothetical protein